MGARTNFRSPHITRTLLENDLIMKIIAYNFIHRNYLSSASVVNVPHEDDDMGIIRIDNDGC
jgi:hypothetical protein